MIGFMCILRCTRMRPQESIAQEPECMPNLSVALNNMNKFPSFH